MDDMSVCLADFGVATVISDMRTNSRSTVGLYYMYFVLHYLDKLTPGNVVDIRNIHQVTFITYSPGELQRPTITIRIYVGSMNWTAPEVQEGPYDARSDVWSVGCIALEFVSCVQYDTANMAGKLIEIKHNSSALEDMLSQASQVDKLNLHGK